VLTKSGFASRAAKVKHPLSAAALKIFQPEKQASTLLHPFHNRFF
jgi:hypothetical protein